MGCTHDCNSCSSSCSSDTKNSFQQEINAQSSVKKVIGIVSGKGGVGKSAVTSMLAAAANREGLKT
ncbi:MAG: P-loop NTPase, partial [Clostridia bacterium]|nr:P-loop NTPase [Clostridia bacterium]